MNNTKVTKMANTERRKYIVVWHCGANYGMHQMTASSPSEAIREHLFFGRKDIELIVFEYNQETMAYKAKESNDIVNNIG